MKQLLDATQSDWKKEQRSLRARFIAATSEAIASHHQSVTAWSAEMHSAMPGIQWDAGTVELGFGSIPRRLGAGGQQWEELDVLLNRRHTAVLGDPGAGKTTTLRRLAHHVAQEPDRAVGDDFRFVVLVVCRDEPWKDLSLHRSICTKLGITGRLAGDLDDPDTRLYQLLNAGAIVLIDGLDEVPAQHRIELEREIVRLGRHLHGGKVVLSCRSADFESLEGFDIAEIQPLAPAQIREVVFTVLGEADAQAFYEAVQRPGHPAADLANRPLFLAQMTAIFATHGTIPDRPSDLCDAITRLVIQEWDEKRRVRRSSKYAEFSLTEKRQFLADLAFALIRRDLLRFEASRVW